jgi:anti-sigma regulatory factor (Ser/Thr protein kinase)
MRAYALIDPTPAVVLERLDALVTSLAVPEQIVTVVYGLVDPDRSSMSVSVAGHPPPLVLPPSGEPQLLDVQAGPPLGLGAGPWHETPAKLTPDTQVLFYSDGLVESRDHDIDEGIARLRDSIAHIADRRRDPRELCARLAERLRRSDSDDDIALLAIMATAGRPSLSASSDFPADTSAAPIARRFLVEQLASWGVAEELTEIARLCLSELVTNAVIHSGTPPRVTVRLDDVRLLVLVQDTGHRGAARRQDQHDPEDVSGRGLMLVEALSDAWSAEHSADGTTVWFELELPPG